MIECEFSVIKYVPDIVRFEPVNIGIALLDKKNKQMHNRYISNFNEFFVRLGIDKINGLERSFENYKPKLDVNSDDYLWTLHDSFHGSIMYSEPIKINTNKIDITIQQVFDKMISITEKKQTIEEKIGVKKIKTRIKNYVKKLEFPKCSYEEKFEINLGSGIPQTRDFAFVKNKKLTHTVDVFNLSEGNAESSLKLFFYEIQGIFSNYQYANTKPLIFSTESEGNNRPLLSFDFIKNIGISIIEPDLQNQKIKEIRETLA